MAERTKGIPLSVVGDVRGTQIAQPITKEAVARQSRGELIAPVLSFGLVSGNPLVLEFAEQLDGDFVPATTDWDVQKNAGSAAITSVAVVGTTVKLTMTVAIVQGDTLTVAYTRPTANTRLRDLRGNEVASFTAQTVLNYTPGAADTTVPVLALATVSGANMVLYFDEQLDTASVPAVTDFAVVIGGSADVVTVVAINGNVVRLTLTTAATYGQSATVAYTVPGANMLQDLAGNDVATFGATTALNYTSTTADTTAPRHSIFLVNTTTLTIEYDEQLDTAFTPATTAYSVVINGAAGVNPSAVSINGSAVRLTISAIVATDTVTVAYTQPGANQLRDLAGNLAASFTAQSCINNSFSLPAGTGVAVYHSADQTTTTGNGLVLSFDTELWDTNAFHSTVSNTSRLTIPAGMGGRYIVHGHIAFAANATGQRNIEIRKGGLTLTQSSVPNMGAGSVAFLSIMTIANLDPGEYVELMVTQFSGGNLDALTSQVAYTEFALVGT